MPLNRTAAVVVAILTVAPWAFFVYMFAMLSSGTFPPIPDPNKPEVFFREFNAIFRVQMLFMVVILGLLAFYIMHVFRTDRVRQDKKALWAVVLLLGNLFAMPVYWYHYIWPKTDKG